MTEYIYGTDGHEGHWLTGEEVVRCRNCKYCDDRAAQEWDEYLAEQYGDPPCYCDSPQWDGPYLHRPVRPNGFCAWAKRREQ